MTDIAVITTNVQSENRAWLLGVHGTELAEGMLIDAALFTQATHFPKGYIPSGTVVSPTGGPYSGTGAAGGILFSSVTPRTVTSKMGGAVLKHAFVKKARLPFQSGTGSLGTGGEAALPLISFSA